LRGTNDRHIACRLSGRAAGLASIASTRGSARI
jgi:hypothetical protein